MLFVCVRTAGHKKRLAPERCSKRYEYFNGLQIQGVAWIKRVKKQCSYQVYLPLFFAIEIKIIFI